MFTPQQAAFFATTASSGSVALRARAGTGKTFSLREWANNARASGIATSFSAATVAELGKKMPSAFASRTLHSIGFDALKRNHAQVKLDKNKIYRIALAIADANQPDFDRQWIRPAMKLASMAKTYGLVPQSANLPFSLLEDTPQSWLLLADQYDIPIDHNIISIAREILTTSNNEALQHGIIDFDDMLYISLLWPHKFPKYPIVIADEVQDFNSLQHLMLQRILRPGGRVIAAGDDRQAIYAFRGALSDSYTSLVNTFSMEEMPLTVSFRCPKAVIACAQKYVPDIEAAPSNVEGEVYHHDNLNLANVPSAVLCRNNAPLVNLAMRLLRAGRSVEIAGIDIGRNLLAITKRISTRNLSSDQFIKRLFKWSAREIAKYPRRKHTIEDKVSALIAIAQTQPDMKSIQAHLEKLYPDPASRLYIPAEVHLSTIHKAKGLEWPNVLILDPQLMPSPHAIQNWELLQEDNLAYVAITRAQNTLHFVESKHII